MFCESIRVQKFFFLSKIKRNIKKQQILKAFASCPVPPYNQSFFFSRANAPSQTHQATNHRLSTNNSGYCLRHGPPSTATDLRPQTRSFTTSKGSATKPGIARSSVVSNLVKPTAPLNKRHPNQSPLMVWPNSSSQVLCIWLQGFWRACVPNFLSFKCRVVFLHHDSPMAEDLSVSRNLQPDRPTLLLGTDERVLCGNVPSLQSLHVFFTKTSWPAPAIGYPI